MPPAAGDTVSKRATLVAAALASFVGAFFSAAVNIALPDIARDLAVEAVDLGWVANATLLVTAAILLPSGRLADIYGRKKVFLWGSVLFAVTSCLCGIAGSTGVLIAFRALQGLGMGAIIGASVAIVISVYPGPDRGRAIGITVAMVYFGLTVGPFIGGLLTQHLGWRSIFFATAALALVSIVITLWKLRVEWRDAAGERYDVVGSLTFFISLIVAMYGFTEVTTVHGVVLLVAGLAGLGLFVWWENRVESPIFNVLVFRRNTVFLFSNLATMISYSAVFAVTFLMSLYLQYSQGMQPQEAGTWLVIRSAVMMVFAPMAGRLSERIEPQRLAAIGMGVNCVALAGFIFLDELSPLWYIGLMLVLSGVGVGLFSSPNTNAVMSAVEKRFTGVASGAQGTMRSGGQMLSVAIVVVLFSIFIGDAQITPAYYPAFLTSFKAGFIIFAALCFGGVFAQLAGRSKAAR